MPSAHTHWKYLLHHFRTKEEPLRFPFHGINKRETYRKHVGQIISETLCIQQSTIFSTEIQRNSSAQLPVWILPKTRMCCWYSGSESTGELIWFRPESFSKDFQVRLYFFRFVGPSDDLAMANTWFVAECSHPGFARNFSLTEISSLDVFLFSALKLRR